MRGLGGFTKKGKPTVNENGDSLYLEYLLKDDELWKVAQLRVRLESGFNYSYFPNVGSIFPRVLGERFGDWLTRLSETGIDPLVSQVPQFRSLAVLAKKFVPRAVAVFQVPPLGFFFPGVIPKFLIIRRCCL